MSTDDDPPPDAGEPQGSKDSGRPAMLGKWFGLAELTGMAVGLVAALVVHALFIDRANGWSWAVFAVLGLGVGGACALFFYGTATDRSDAGEDLPHGRADVSERGEWRKTLDRRRHRPSKPPVR